MDLDFYWDWRTPIKRLFQGAALIVCFWLAWFAMYLVPGWTVNLDRSHLKTIIKQIDQGKLRPDENHIFYLTGDEKGWTNGGVVFGTSDSDGFSALYFPCYNWGGTTRGDVLVRKWSPNQADHLKIVNILGLNTTFNCWPGTGYSCEMVFEVRHKLGNDWFYVVSTNYH